MILDEEEEEKKKQEEAKAKEEAKLNVNDKKCKSPFLKNSLTTLQKVQEENIEIFFKQLGDLKWEKPEETKLEIRKLLRNIDRKFVLS